MRSPILLALATTLVFAGCGGGSGSTGSGGVTPGGGGGSGTSTQSVTQRSVDAANALGDPVKSFTDFNGSVADAQSLLRRGAQSAAVSGTCTNGVEFYAPDKKGDPNSTETEDFYDTACTELALDAVRLYSISGTSETVNTTTSLYAINNGTPIATRTGTAAIANATFGTNGFPLSASGFHRSNMQALNVSGSRTILSDDELVLTASSGNVNTYCGDSAGYNATGVAALDESNGWQGGVLSGGTRTVNSNGTVTWQATHTGTTARAAIGSLSIAVGSANTACPITAPEFTLSGGTTTGSYSLPVTATYQNGILTALSVTNATLGNGDTLNVTSSTTLSPTNADFITGTVSSNGSQISTFATDAFGDGTLTVTSSGAQFVITDWHVVK